MNFALPSVTELVHGSTVRLAVTGLHRAGKTVFITSLIHNLLSASRNPRWMSLLSAIAEGRFVAASLAAEGHQEVPRFPYRANLEALAADPPTWPGNTDRISEIGLKLRFTPGGLLGRDGLLGGWLGESAMLELRIVDYPGEWLLDLPLLDLSFAEWSQATLDLCLSGPRAESARAWLGYLADHPPQESADEEVAKRAHDLYRDYLIECREKHGLCYLQPGRFVQMGEMLDAPILWFCPLRLAPGEEPPAGSLAALMAGRFEAYKKRIVRRFAHEHFERFHRQLVLVDVLSALHGGEHVFEDVRRSLEVIARWFRFGSNRWLAGWLSPKIERVLFAATKSDHLPFAQRPALTALLESLVADPANWAKWKGAQVEVMALASVICTQETVKEIEGRTVEAVTGMPMGMERRVTFIPGAIPAVPPRPGGWSERFTGFPEFQPPRLAVAPTEGVPNIHLDRALEFLVGDKLR